MRLRSVHSTHDLGRYFASKGLSPGENFYFGGVNPVHVGAHTSWASLHYHRWNLGTLGQKRSDGTPQGDLAIDLNDRDVSDDTFHRLIRGQWRIWRPSSETEALKFIYGRIHTVARKRHWPLYEMFFDSLGFMQSLGYDVNHAITGHDDHLHVGFSKSSW